MATSASGTAHLKLLREANQIRYKLRDGEHKQHLRILLLGLPGVGKSSLVSSMLMAINPRGYEDIAMRGSYGVGGKGGRAAITLTLQCIRPFQYIDKKGEEHKYICQPQIWDCPGLPDSDEDNVTLILRMIIDGKVPEGTNMTNLLDKPDEEIKSLKWRSNKDNLIDIVIVVHAALDPVPENLMNAIRNAAQPNQDGQRLVPVFGIISKLDKLERKDQLKKIVENFSAELGLQGAEERIFPTSLYCKEVSPGLFRKHDIDKVMCDLWNAMLNAKFVKIKDKSFFSFLKS